MKKNKVIFFLFCVFFACSFLYSFSDRFFDDLSENLAIGPIYAISKNWNIDTKNYGLGRLQLFEGQTDQRKYIYELVFNGNKEYTDFYDYNIYTSQVGLQGIVYQKLTKLLLPYMNFKLIIRGLRFCCTLFLSVILCLIAWQLNKKYGSAFAVVFILVTLLSNLIQNFSTNLYWVEFTWFIPMLLGLFVLNYENKRAFIYPLFYFAILIKCLCGYEYISTIMMSSIMFLCVEWILHKEKRKEMIKAIFIIGILSLLAFFTAYIIHAYMYGSGDIVQGLSMMKKDLIEKRTYGNPENFSELELKESLNVSLFNVLWQFIGLGTHRGIYFFLLIIVSLYLIFYRSKILKQDSKFEISLFVMTFLSSLSWIVLAKAHSYIHMHMNFVVSYMGWVQTCVYIIIKTLFEKYGYVIKKENQK